MYRYRVPLLLLALLVIVLVPHGAFAAVSDFLGPIIPKGSGTSDLQTCAAGWQGAVLVLNNLVKFVISFGFVVAVLTIAYAGFLLVINPAMPESRSTAKSLLINAAIGIALMLGAWLLVNTILVALTGGERNIGYFTGFLSGGDMCIPITTATGNTLGAGSGGGGLSGVGGCSVGQTCSETTKTCGPAQAKCGDATCAENQVCSADGKSCETKACTPPSQQGTGPNCPAADPASMVTFSSSVVSGDSEKATAATVQNFMAMRAAALHDGIDLKVTDGYRSEAEQLSLWEQYHHDTSQVAKPCSLGGGGSNHNSGTALDLTVGCSKTGACSSPQYKWLKEHGAQWNFRNALPNDNVHWSPTGH
jgi:hypothetical protein